MEPSLRLPVRPATGLAFVALAGLGGVSVLFHPLLPEAPTEAARIVVEQPRWNEVHLAFLLAAVAGAVGAWALPGGTVGFSAGRALALVGFAALSVTMLLEILALGPTAARTVEGDATAARTFASTFDAAAFLFHAGVALALAGFFPLAWAVARRRTSAPAGLGLLGVSAIPLGVLASVAAMAFPAPETMIVGLPGVAVLLAWPGVLGLFFLRDAIRGARAAGAPSA
ncbi:MAG TPA: hypothetical protein VM681_04405 [Candidatus Thermoplasmatota archaeon]|nr:hypothetical protein [Candidatus Thermoplasmatota archaeon]